MDEHDGVEPVSDDAEGQDAANSAQGNDKAGDEPGSRGTTDSGNFPDQPPSPTEILWRAIWERAQTPFLLLVVAGLLLIIYRRLDYFGLPHLFWHANLAVQFVAGAGVGMFFGEVAFVAFLLDTRHSWLSRYCQTGSEATISRYLNTVTAGLLVLLVPALFVGETAGLLPGSLSFLVGAIGGAGAIRMLGRYLRGWATGAAERRALGWLSRLVQRVDPHERQPLVWVHALAACYFGVLTLGILIAAAVCYLADPLPIVLDQLLSPGMIICVLLALLVRIYGFIQFHFRQYYFLAVAALIAWPVAAGYLDTSSGYKYQLPGVPYDAEPTSLAEVISRHAESTAAPTQEIGADLDNWRRQFRKRPKLVVVTASGGGLRAAAWTSMVLAKLEEELQTQHADGTTVAFPYHVRLITGASGGMVGAAHYVVTLEPPGNSGPHHRDHRDGELVTATDLVGHITRDSLAPVARALAFHDIPRLFIPWLGGNNRGQALENAWLSNTGGAQSLLNTPLADLREDELAGWRPSLVFTPALVEDGRRVLISNLDLTPLCRSRGSLVEKSGDQGFFGRVYSVPALPFEELVPEHQLRVSTAARMSATFAYITPASDLPVTPPRRVVDAGYYDNYGVNLAANWLWQHRAVLRDKLELSGIVLVQIRDQRTAGRAANRSNWPSATSWATTPLEGAIRAYDSSSYLRNDEQLEGLDQYFNFQATQFFTTVVFEYEHQASLSWYLTPQELRQMEASLDAQTDGEEPINQQRMTWLKEWWEADNRPAVRRN